MNLSNSEYSSGCESGWTMYLDQLSNISTNDPFVTNIEGGKSVNIEDEDEDLSMVSDASSGPPHYFHEYDEKYETLYFSAHEDKKKGREKSKTKETIINYRAKKQQNLCLDDTASSPVFDFSQDNVPPPDFPQVFSGAHFEFAGKKEAVRNGKDYNIFWVFCCNLLKRWGLRCKK
ncbi:hypothetical protein DH2020_008278 [Rehmannia glutinosa]|uniref:Uncharacterized protein n=1 Tax=Rehmannia glutinosa TaxID=99300 RepID=A0ABR0U0Z0_REHGL